MTSRKLTFHEEKAIIDPERRKAAAVFAFFAPNKIPDEIRGTSARRAGNVARCRATCAANLTYSMVPTAALPHVTGIRRRGRSPRSRFKCPVRQWERATHANARTARSTPRLPLSKCVSARSRAISNGRGHTLGVGNGDRSARGARGVGAGGLPVGNHTQNRRCVR